MRSEKNEKKFKLLLLDIGLLQCALEVPADIFQTASLMQVNSGILAEQFVGQEILAYMDCYLDKKLYFWERSKVGSMAEIDYVVNIGGRIIPIEVKAGKTGRMRSLKQFLATKPSTLGLRISTEPLALEGNILSVPLYMIRQIERLIQTL